MFKEMQMTIMFQVPHRSGFELILFYISWLLVSGKNTFK